MKRLVMPVLLLALLCGCTSSPETIGTQPTVEDIFVPPTTTAAPISPDATEPQDITDMFPGLPSPLGGGGSGLTTPMERDENGRKCYEYHGGEMAVSFWAEGNGVFLETGVGFLLFTDGIPQPYRVSEDGEYSYLHTFDMEDYTLSTQDPGDYRLDVTFLFEPVAGKQGDYIECVIVKLNYPDYSPAAVGDKGARPYTLIMGGGYKSMFVLKCMEDPPETELIPVQERLYDLDVTKVDTTYAEVSGWSGDDYLKDIRTNVFVCDFDANYHANICKVTKEHEITLRFEIWGSPLVRYRLVYFMNNQPVSVAEENIIDITVEQGKKTIVTAKLDISDFDKEASIYCILVARNRLEYGAAAGQAASGAYSYFWLHEHGSAIPGYGEL